MLKISRSKNRVQPTLKLEKRKPGHRKFPPQKGRRKNDY